MRFRIATFALACIAALASFAVPGRSEAAAGRHSEQGLTLADSVVVTADLVAIARPGGSSVFLIAERQWATVKGMSPADVAALPTPLQTCIASAIQACGAGHICSVVFHGQSGDCEVTCYDQHGDCPTPPAVKPPPAPPSTSPAGASK